jgi:hypothetical protein
MVCCDMRKEHLWNVCTTKSKPFQSCEILGSHGGEYEDQSAVSVLDNPSSTLGDGVEYLLVSGACVHSVNTWGQHSQTTFWKVLLVDGGLILVKKVHRQSWRVLVSTRFVGMDCYLYSPRNNKNKSRIRKCHYILQPSIVSFTPEVRTPAMYMLLGN